MAFEHAKIKFINYDTVSDQRPALACECDLVIHIVIVAPDLKSGVMYEFGNNYRSPQCRTCVGGYFSPPTGPPRLD